MTRIKQTQAHLWYWTIKVYKKGLFINLLLCHVNLSMQLININLNDIILIYSSDDSFFYKPLCWYALYHVRRTRWPENGSMIKFYVSYKNWISRLTWWTWCHKLITLVSCPWIWAAGQGIKKNLIWSLIADGRVAFRQQLWTSALQQACQNWGN